MGVSAPMVVSMCSKYLSYDIGGGDWRNRKEQEEEEILIRHNKRDVQVSPHTRWSVGAVDVRFQTINWYMRQSGPRCFIRHCRVMAMDGDTRSASQFAVHATYIS